MRIQATTILTASGFLLGVLGGYLLFAPSTSDNENQASEPSTSEASRNLSLDALSSTTRLPTAGNEEKPATALDWAAASHPHALANARAKLEGQLERQLVYELSETDPAAAAAFLEQIGPAQRQGLTTSILNNWAAQDPAAAFNWLRSLETTLPDNEYRMGLATTLNAYAQVDPFFVQDQLHLVDVESRGTLLFEIAGSLADKNPAQAMEWFSSLSDDSLRPQDLTSSYVRIMERYIESNPQEAMRAIERLDSASLLNQLAPPAAAQLAASDMDDAINWIRSLPSQEAQAASVASVAQSLLDSNPAAALNALINMSELYEARVTTDLSNVLYALAHKQPQLLVERFAELAQGAQQEAAIAITESWLANPKSVTGYTDWISELPSGPALDRSASVLSRYYRDEDPIEALSWAQNLSDASERRSLMKEVLDYSSSEQLVALSASLPELDLPSDEMKELGAIIEKRFAEDYSTLVLP